MNNSYYENLKYDLTCPISLDWMKDPIQVPCCGQFFSREHLLGYLKFVPLNLDSNCPICNKMLYHSDVEKIPINVKFANIVEEIKYTLFDINSPFIPMKCSQVSIFD